MAGSLCHREKRIMEEQNRDIERTKMQHESNLRQYDAENAASLELFKSAITSAQSALKSAIMINGGAAVAVMAFVGTTWNKLEDPVVSRILLWSMGLFVVGVFWGAVASGFTYLCQDAYANERIKRGNVYRWIAICLVVVSYIFFVIASGVAIWGFGKNGSSCGERQTVLSGAFCNMDILTMSLDVLMAIGKYIIENAGAIAALVGVVIAFYGLETWKREYRFKRNSELLEEALVLFYQAEHAIAYLRNIFIVSNELQDFEFPSELEDGYSKEKYKYTYTIRRRFDEKQSIFNKLYAIELRFRARFGIESITAFNSMRDKVKELLITASRYSIKGLDKEEIVEIQKIIWKDYNIQFKDGDTFGDAINKIVEDFDKLCRSKIKKNK